MLDRTSISHYDNIQIIQNVIKKGSYYETFRGGGGLFVICPTVQSF